MTQIRQLWIEPISYGIGNEVLGSAQILVASAAAWPSSQAGNAKIPSLDIDLVPA